MENKQPNLASLLMHDRPVDPCSIVCIRLFNNIPILCRYCIMLFFTVQSCLTFARYTCIGSMPFLSRLLGFRGQQEQSRIMVLFSHTERDAMSSRQTNSRGNGTRLVNFMMFMTKIYTSEPGQMRTRADAKQESLCQSCSPATAHSSTALDRIHRGRDPREQRQY